MATKLQKLEDQLWNAADGLRANSELSSNEYSTPVLGLIFLRYADYKFTETAKKLNSDNPDKLDVQAEGVMYLPPEARYKTLLDLPEGSDIGKAINDAMKAVERENDDLRGILPKSYTTIDNRILIDLLKNFNAADFSEGDVFGKIYEYFLGKFAMAEGQGGGEFFTPISLVKLIVEIIEPYQGKIFDPACGSGGMFVQSANFVQAHHKSANTSLSVYGQEKTAATVKLGKMNMAVHGLYGDIRQGNTFYEDIHDSVGKFDFVMANPPFNVNGVDKDRIKNDPRYRLGIPNVDNANYLWIQHFYSALNEAGRAGFVMHDSATDSPSSEREIRKRIIQEGTVDVLVAVGTNMFYTVTLGCTLWFLDKSKRGSDRSKKVLFIDAKQLYEQIDRAHREFSDKQIEFIANLVNLYRSETPEFTKGSEELFNLFNTSTEFYEDIPGFCKVVTVDEIEEKNWSLNPGLYVGTEEKEIDLTALEKSEQRLINELSLLIKNEKLIQARLATPHTKKKLSVSGAAKKVEEVIISPKRQKKVKRSDYLPEGHYAIVDQSQSFISGYTNDDSMLYDGPLPVIVFGDHTRILKYIDFPFCVGADGTQLILPKENIDTRYLYLALLKADLKHYGYQRHYKYLKKEVVIIPAPDEQCSIADRIFPYEELRIIAAKKGYVLQALRDVQLRLGLG